MSVGHNGYVIEVFEEVDLNFRANSEWFAYVHDRIGKVYETPHHKTRAAAHADAAAWIDRQSG